MRTNLIKSDREYNRILDDMKGIDAAARAEHATSRYAYAENMYRDYSTEKGGLIESVPGFRKVYQGKKIYGLHLQTTRAGERYVIINDNGVLRRYKEGYSEEITKITENPYVAQTQSYSFNFGGKFFLGDGYNLFEITDSGSSRSVSDNGANAPYIPTVYLDGDEHEQRNLLTRMCYESFSLLPPTRLMRATPTLLYKITDEKSKHCAVFGISSNASVVYIPETVRLGSEEYTVTEIASGAFASNNYIRRVSVADSVKSVGVGAFYDCSSLTSFIGGASLEQICDMAFDCSSLSDIYIPAGFKEFGTGAIPVNTTIRYELGESAFGNINGAPEDNPVRYGIREDIMSLGARIRTKAISVISVKIDGESISNYSTELDADGCVSQVIIDEVSKSGWTGKRLEICLYAKEKVTQESKYGDDFTKFCERFDKIFSAVIYYCRHAAVIDGRIFAWGNPNFPSFVFYSSKNDTDNSLYFGSLDYLNVGSGEVLSVLPILDGIAVFAKQAEGGESIFFCERSERESGDGCYVFSGTPRRAALSGAVASINGESIFLTDSGLFAIGEKNLYETYTIEPRSSLITPLLLNERLGDATLSEWCGYTVLSVGGNLYLEDPRRSIKIEGVTEHEWFRLSGVGTYRGDRRVYRYASTKRDGYTLSEHPDERVSEEVWSEGTDDGETVYFVNRGDERIEVYPTEEMEGGDFYGAQILLGFEDRLIFSTDCGDVCAFNTDMRGVAPARLASAPDFDAEEYKARMGKRIHPDFYDFNLHAPRYALVTIADDCGIPHLRKSTVKRSLTLKLATFIGGRLHCEVSRDSQGFKRVGVVDGGITDLSTLSFVSLPFDGSDSVTVTLPEGERGWVEKSIALYSEDFRSPIGVYSICYRYRISGRIKNS